MHMGRVRNRWGKLVAMTTPSQTAAPADHAGAKRVAEGVIHCKNSVTDGFCVRCTDAALELARYVLALSSPGAAAALGCDALRSTEFRGIYVASRTHHAKFWREYRAQGFNITSSWIDESGEGETADMGELWTRIVREVGASKSVLIYVNGADFPLKGALIEVGAAIALGKRIILCAPGVVFEKRSCRPIGSWINHPLVARVDHIAEALYAAANESLTPPPTQPEPNAVQPKPAPSQETKI